MNVGGMLQTLAVISGLITVGLFALAVVQASRRQKLHNAGLLIGIFLALTLVLATVGSGIVFVNPQEAAVVISYISPKGYRDAPLYSGMHLIVPYAESIQTYPISKQTYTMSVAPQEGQIQGDDSISARTLDGQEIFIDASVIYQIDASKLVQVHIQWQHRYQDDLVRPQTRGAIRDAVSQYRVEEAVSTKRYEMVQNISQSLAQKLSDNGLTLVDFVLRNVTFSPEYAASVEQKQISEQQAQQAKFVVEQKKQEAEQARQEAQGLADAAVIRAKGDADARIIQAQAEAQALTLINNSIKDNKDLLTYQYISKLAPGIQVMLVPNNSPYFLPLPSLQTTTTPETTSTTPETTTTTPMTTTVPTQP